MKISQFNLQYNSLQDRLLLRMNSSSDERVEFWLTRRYLIALWGVLMQLIAEDLDVASQANDNNKQSILAFKRQKSLSTLDTKKPFNSDPATRWPLGETPLLLSKIQIRRSVGRPADLWLGDARDTGLALPVTETLPHLLIHLIINSHQKSAWQIDTIDLYNRQTDPVSLQTRQVN